MAKNKRVHTRWIEKYRPKHLDDYAGNDETVAKIKENIENNDIPHYLFAGVPGTGKSTLAKIITEMVDCDYIYINASDENGIETIREKVKDFASTSTFKTLKVIILDEADFLTLNAQKALLDVIEKFSLTTRFILTCNDLTRIIPALRSRCEIETIAAQSKGAIAKLVCTNILDVEGVKYDIKDVATVINQHYPDVRSIIKNLQKFTSRGVLTVGKFDKLYTSEILTELSKPNDKSWYSIRQIIANHNVSEYQTLYRFLFDNLEKFSKGNDAGITIILDEFIWKANNVPDKEINCAACMARILETIK